MHARTAWRETRPGSRKFANLLPLQATQSKTPRTAMISHRYEDYANRLGIHILDALTAVLLWPGFALGVLWSMHGVPTCFGGMPSLSASAHNALCASVVIPLSELICRQLRWFSIPFGLHDPRRAMMYPYTIYLVKLILLCITLFFWQQLMLSYAPQLEPYADLPMGVAMSLAMVIVPLYAFRIATLRRKGCSQ